MSRKNKEQSVFDLIEAFAKELVREGIQEKKPKAVPNVRIQVKGKKI